MSSSRVVRRALGPIVLLFAFLGLAAAPPASLAAPGSLCNTPSAAGCAGATDLPSTVNDQHYDLEVGATITGKIIGATDLDGTETCTGDGPGVDVIIKSSDFGNQTVCGSLLGCPGATCTITFTYTAPNGPTVCACNTGIVAYGASGNNSNNDIIDNGMKDGSADGPAGYAYLDANGQQITTCGCPTTTTTSTTTSTTSTTTTTSTTETTTTTTSTTTSTTETTTSTTSTTTTTTTSTTTSTTSTTSSTTTSTTTSTTSTSTTTTTTTTTSTSTTSTTTTTVSTTTTTSIPFQVRDHFQCYELKPAALPPTTVTVKDQFGTQALTLRFPHRLCAPADKNGEGIFDEIQHLVGYDTLRTPFTKRTGFPVTNQFGTITIDLTRRDLLMVPTAKSLVAPPPPLQPPTIDHFQCYRAKRSAGSPKFAKINATVADQFESLTLTLLKPYRLCVPASKNGEDPTAPDHPDLLLCYKSKSSTKFGTILAHINNQFGPDDVTLIHRRELCVPSFNPEATTTTTTTSTSTTTTTTTPSLCGNGLVDPGETCDTGIPAGPGACPTSCNDGDSCTTDTLSNPGTCTATCTTTPVTVCHSGDGCCPLGCTNANDDDCAPLCMPDCSGKTCGDDGCGGSCGDCTTPGQVCGNIAGDGQACCFPPGTMNVCTVDNFVSVCCAGANGVGCDFTGGNPGACFN